MSAAAPQAAEPRSTGHLVAQLGDRALYRVNDDHFMLFTPDNGYSQAWLEAHLPAGGDWFTYWAGCGDSLVVHLSR